MNPQSHLDDFRWLLGDAGAEWLRRVAEEPQPTVSVARRLRKELSPERTHLVLQQAELRRGATVKFPGAEAMFFTPTGLEQATDHWVAASKAARFPAGGAVADLCCGIGGDLLALAGRGPTEGVDRDPVTALLAEANLGMLARERTDHAAAFVRPVDVAAVNLGDFAAWHIDPDRRPQGRRTTRVELHEPDAETIQRMLEKHPNAAVKLAPAATLPEDWASRAELEWIGRQRQCRQLVAWFGELARQPGVRRATVLLESGSDRPPRARSLVGNPSGTLPVAPQVGRFVFDPDPAVLASGLTAVLADAYGLGAVATNISYLTGDRPIEDPLLACFEVSEVLPLDRKRLRLLLESRGIGRLEIKKRGVSEDPEQLRRQLRLRGDRAAVLLIAPIAGTVTAILAERVERGEL